MRVNQVRPKRQGRPKLSLGLCPTLTSSRDPSQSQVRKCVGRIQQHPATKRITRSIIVLRPVQRYPWTRMGGAVRRIHREHLFIAMTALVGPSGFSHEIRQVKIGRSSEPVADGAKNFFRLCQIALEPCHDSLPDTLVRIRQVLLSMTA